MKEKYRGPRWYIKGNLIWPGGERIIRKGFPGDAMFALVVVGWEGAKILRTSQINYKLWEG